MKGISYEFIVYNYILKPGEFQMAEDPPTWGSASKAWGAQQEDGSQETQKDKSSALHRLGAGTHAVRNPYTHTRLCDLMVLNVSNKP